MQDDQLEAEEAERVQAEEEEFAEEEGVLLPTAESETGVTIIRSPIFKTTDSPAPAAPADQDAVAATGAPHTQFHSWLTM